MSELSEKHIISSVEVANYVVCPEAWRLKYVSKENKPARPSVQHEAPGIRKDWVKEQELSRTLRGYAKIVYLLIVLVVIVVFLMDIKRSLNARPQQNSPTVEASLSTQEETQRPEALPRSENALKQSLSDVIKHSKKSIPAEIAYLLLIVGLLIVLWDFFERHSSKLRSDSGLTKDAEVVAAKDSSEQPVFEGISESLGLSSRPDAVIKEDGTLLPVDIEPMGSKVRDRHVVAMLVHLRVLEEHQGTPPPYGVLLMGKKKRQVRIKNTEEKQRWLDSLLEEMRSIRGGVPAIPAPVYAKCKNCDVNSICEHRIS